MKCVLLTLLTFSTFIFTSAFANPTEQSGKSVFSFKITEIEDFQNAGGKDNPNKNKDKAKKAKKEKDEVEDEITEDSDKLKGLEKQTAKKADQEQKELDKGSEQGQTSREEHRKKWWQFWDDDTEK